MVVVGGGLFEEGAEGGGGAFYAEACDPQCSSSFSRVGPQKVCRRTLSL